MGTLLLWIGPPRLWHRTCARRGGRVCEAVDAGQVELGRPEERRLATERCAFRAAADPRRQQDGWASGCGRSASLIHCHFRARARGAGTRVRLRVAGRAVLGPARASYHEVGQGSIPPTAASCPQRCGAYASTRRQSEASRCSPASRGRCAATPLRRGVDSPSGPGRRRRSARAGREARRAPDRSGRRGGSCASITVAARVVAVTSFYTTPERPTACGLVRR